MDATNARVSDAAAAYPRADVSCFSGMTDEAFDVWSGDDLLGQTDEPEEVFMLMLETALRREPHYVVLGRDESEAFRRRIEALAPIVDEVDPEFKGALLVSGDPSEWRDVSAYLRSEAAKQDPMVVRLRSAGLWPL